MTWDYRLCRYPRDGSFGLHEVYYNEAGEATSITDSAVGFVCDKDEGPEGVIRSLEQALADAKTKPIFDVPPGWILGA